MYESALTHLVFLAVYFKHRYGAFSVHFISWRMLPHTLGLKKTIKKRFKSIYTVGVAVVTTPVCDSHHVSPEDGLALHVLETEFTHVEATQAGVLLGIGRVVPGVQLVAPKQDGLDHVTALRDLTLDAQLLLRAGQNQEAN